MTSTEPRPYAGLFGWNIETGPSPGGHGDYTTISVGENTNGGILPIDDSWPEHIPNHWAVYLSVADADDSTSAAKDLGGEIVMPAMSIPQVGTLVVLRDPSGAIFTIMEAASQLDES